MATLAPTFRAESEKIHREHQDLEKELFSLEFALDRLVCHAEVFADLSSAGEVRRHGRSLAEQFPGHCRREEEHLLGPVSRISPELAEFADEMKRQHGQLLERLNRFCSALERLETSPDLEEAIWSVKETGGEFLRAVRRHVGIEESELNGFL